MNQEADSGHDENHHAGERVEKKSPVRHESHEVPARHLHRARRQPFEQNLLGHTMLRIRGQQLKNRPHRANKR